MWIYLNVWIVKLPKNVFQNWSSTGVERLDRNFAIEQFNFMKYFYRWKVSPEETFANTYDFAWVNFREWFGKEF